MNPVQNWPKSSLDDFSKSKITERKLGDDSLETGGIRCSRFLPGFGSFFESAGIGIGGVLADRARAGRERAKERGVPFGRPRKLTPHQRQEALARLAAGETQAAIRSPSGSFYSLGATRWRRIVDSALRRL
jgi:transposase